MKVLIISHNPLCGYNAMGKTLATLFSRFDREELCQLYIYPSYPDFAACSSYFRMTDKEALGGIFTRRAPGKTVEPDRIHPGQTPFERAGDAALYRNVRNKSPLRRLGRDLIWRLTPWYSPDLRNWLDREMPSCIFVAPGAGKFLYDFALRIAEDRGLPIVCYLCDEYYFVEPSRKTFGRLQLRLLQRKMERLMKNAALLITINEELKTAYGARFGVPAQVIMTGSGISIGKGTGQSNAVCYFGNIRCGRASALAEVGRALDRLNRERGSGYALKIYTAEGDPQILAALKGVDCLELCPFLQGEDYEQALRGAGLLLHVESFETDFARRSVSTKLADYLASGVPVLAYGPGDYASIAHLRRNNCAFLTGSPAELEERLSQALTDGAARQTVTARAMETAARLHNAETNSLRLHGLLEGVGP